ncbi:MAG: hypothetical protein H6Q91_1373 [Deltaproteobacteria bacterium]|nr:hypothetical protein [Deltaproteobacteria bacterium]
MSAAGESDLVARARAFVLGQGDALQRARATALFDPSARETVCKLLGAIEDPARAATAIAVLDAIGVRRGAEVERAVAIVSAAQRDDGSWTLGDEPGAGDDGARVVTTAQIAGQLAKTACARPNVLRAAGAFLAAHWSPDRVQGGDPLAIAGYAQWYANTDDELSDAALQWCGRELERGFRTGAIDALDTARVFALCDAQSLPGARLAADELVLSLAAEQSPDGSFGPASAPIPVRVEATLDALAALQRLAPRKRA